MGPPISFRTLILKVCFLGASPSGMFTVMLGIFLIFRCKLFYKKENEFKEKGVGTLHLKQVADGKTQLLVRADTNLGKASSPTCFRLIHSA